MTIKAVGICLGASTVKVVALERRSQGRSCIIESRTVEHSGDAHSTLARVTAPFTENEFRYGMLTGGRFAASTGSRSITEPEAVEYALRLGGEWVGSDGQVVLLSLGAENFIAYGIDRSGSICQVETGNKCASGTGGFYVQQIQRMGLGLDEAATSARAAEPFAVSGRCSVFCKSDCTHALNKGVPIGQVAAGLCRMVADRVIELTAKFSGSVAVVAVGGVTRNSVIMDMVRQRIPHLIIPDHADVFEAVGAAEYALEKRTPWHGGTNLAVRHETCSFAHLPPLASAASKVRFEQLMHSVACEGDEIIVGLDVGSTTTKAVAIRARDTSLVASVYLRTNGDPVKASRACYDELRTRMGAAAEVTGLGVTGSGRHIAGLHAETDAVINEIIAHATAASHFDKGVDTILEIGGQDAKYTYLTSGVPSDYAMNEACSAGTGSFLEESAGQAFGIGCTDIEPIALKSDHPRNFSDQCAAFIASDITVAVHEGIPREDIIAGLVYSVCMNYVNRVRGRRTVGARVFMQGGVCYNKAVPFAMANLLGKEIIVPPEPGLMGAFGVALEARQRLERGECTPGSWDLDELSRREVSRVDRFVCGGGREHCDRRCEIDVLLVNGQRYPFGGACNKYERRKGATKDSRRYNLVRRRAALNLETTHSRDAASPGPRVGINRSFLTHMLYPLYATFFEELGLRVVIPDRMDPSGFQRTRTSFCFPAELAHGAFAALLDMQPDYLFLPAVVELPVDATAPKREHQCTCVLMQGEPYYLKSAFRQELKDTTILSPSLDFSAGYGSQAQVFADIAHACGKTRREGRAAYQHAVERHAACTAAVKAIGRDVLAEVEHKADSFAIVLLGRPYNAFAPEANLGIPEKLAAQGVPVIPWDSLPLEGTKSGYTMCWAMGENLLRAARFVSTHPNLYPVYVTNFSCGPDSFLVGYFRDMMGSKPSLTLELDRHTADAGITTRIEAFYDIVRRSRTLPARKSAPQSFTPAKVCARNKRLEVVSSEGKHLALTDPRVHVLLPSMGAQMSAFCAAAFRGMGIRCSALPPNDGESLRLGRGVTSCKECLPLLLTSGALMRYLEQRREQDEVLVYFMPTCAGNCRFTQYSVFLDRLIRSKRLENVALLTLSNEDGYQGLPWTGLLNVLKAILIADVLDDVRNAMLVLARDKDAALKRLVQQQQRLIGCLENGGRGFWPALSAAARDLRAIELRYALSDARTVILTGEIFARRDDFTCRELLDKLVSRDIVVKRAPVAEWLGYCDYNVKHGYYQADFDLSGWLQFEAKRLLMRHFESKIRRTLSASGLCEKEQVPVDEIVECGSHFFDPRFTGESLLVVGGFFREILHAAHGVLSIGPFACMHTRVAEAVLAAESSTRTKRDLDPTCTGIEALGTLERLPFLSVETDGNPLPRLVEARLEAFCLQVERVHAMMWKGADEDGGPSGRRPGGVRRKPATVDGASEAGGGGHRSPAAAVCRNTSQA